MIQFITHANAQYGYVEGARLALEGGCRWVQLRMKDADEATFLAAAKEIGALCKTYNAVFVLDDHVEWVKQTGANGVHLGKNDMPVDEAPRCRLHWLWSVSIYHYQKKSFARIGFSGLRKHCATNERSPHSVAHSGNWRHLKDGHPSHYANRRNRHSCERWHFKC